MPSIVARNPSILGGILLVLGNVIGAGILALPIATAQLGLPYAIFILLCFWVIMALGSYYFLEANLALPSGANLISMSKATLGKWGTTITWICYLLVMYSTIAAFIAGGGDLVKINFYYLGITMPSGLASVLFTLAFGFIVSRGIHITDYTNRILMALKAAIFITAILGLASHFNANIISIIPQKSISSSLLIVVITSYSFATLIPSLRNYYQSDIKKIKTIIFWGTLIAFLSYVCWVTFVFSVVPYHGDFGLENMSTSTHPVSDLQSALSQALHIPWITQATNIFSSICIITSFLANSISFTDFIADGLHLKNHNNKTFSVYFIAFFPAVCAVLFYPRAFLIGLSIAGISAIILLLILPGLMVWSLRYSNKHKKLSYSVMGGKPLLLFLLVVSFGLLAFSL